MVYEAVYGEGEPAITYTYQTIFFEFIQTIE